MLGELWCGTANGLFCASPQIMTPHFPSHAGSLRPSNMGYPWSFATTKRSPKRQRQRSLYSCVNASMLQTGCGHPSTVGMIGCIWVWMP